MLTLFLCVNIMRNNNIQNLTQELRDLKSNFETLRLDVTHLRHFILITVLGANVTQVVAPNIIKELKQPAVPTQHLITAKNDYN